MTTISGLGSAPTHRDATQLRSRAAPASPDFSGWNWVAQSGPFSTAATNRSPPCSAQVHQRGAGAAVGAQAPGRARRRSARSRTARPRRRRTARSPSGDLDGVPAHVRHDRRLQPLDHARPLVAALGLDAVLDAALEQHLHADADAEHRPPAGEPATDQRADRRRRAARPCRRRTRRRRARRARRPSSRRVRSAVSVDVGAGALEGAHGRAEVAGAVVEDDDRRARAVTRRSPFVRRHARLARVERDGVAEAPGRPP